MKDLDFKAILGKGEVLSLVDPRIETEFCRWFHSSPAARPFGMAKVVPHTFNQRWRAGYDARRPHALGFCHLHGWQSTGLEVMPTAGGDFAVDRGEAGWSSPYDPATEIAKPGYHRLFLKKYGVWVELTTTPRVGMHRYTFTRGGRGDVIVNLGGELGKGMLSMRNGKIAKADATTLEGWYDRITSVWSGPKEVRVFFVIGFDRPFSRFTPYTDPKFNSTSGYVTFDRLSPGDELRMKVGLSFTSVEAARENLASELGHWAFDRVRDESFREWNSMLGKIEVEGGTPAQRIRFYTDLWHVLLGRHILTDVGGTYPDYTDGKGGNGPLKVRRLPLGKDGKPRFNMYNSDAFWLTQWNLNLIWGMAWPNILDDFANCILQMARNGRKMPRGPCGGGYTFIMTACPATPLVVSTYMKGLNPFDSEEAFAIIKDNHSVDGANMLGASRFYLENGWDPGRLSAGVTVEMCYEDWCAAQMAKKLGKEEDYAEFLRRSEGWKKLFHKESSLLMPRKRNGTFLHNDPLDWHGWVEGNAWSGSWFCSYDVQGLANLMGGRDRYISKLNFAFEQALPHRFMKSKRGYVWYGNQPSCQNAHLFSHAGEPWLTQYWVRQVKERAFSNITAKYGGYDEDQGQMGGVSALMAIGLFSVRGTCSPDPIYEITSPIFDRITIHLDPRYYKGSRFVITAKNNSEKNCYIQSATLNGTPLERFWFYHRDFAKGGTLALTLGPEPNRQWGIRDIPASESKPLEKGKGTE